MKTIIIDVTQDDIDCGCREDGENCPIAKAVERKTGLAVNVTEREVEFDHCDYSALLPEEAQQFVYEFDLDQRDVEPFSFTLEVPDGF